MHTPKPVRRLPGIPPPAGWVGRGLVRVALVDVARVGLVVAGLPDPRVAVPRPAAGDPVVTGHRVIALDDPGRAPIVVVVPLANDGPRDVDRPALVAVVS